ATYILPGLIEASESSYAVLALTSDVSVAATGKYPLTEVDQEALMRPLTKWNAVVRRGDHVPRMVRAAFRAMTTGRPGAAHLGLPFDVLNEPVDPSDIWADPTTGAFPAYPQAPAPGAAEAAVDAILSAKKPLIVAGGGVVIAGAEAELARLATRLDIPVATSISGQGALAEVDPQAVGVVGSNGGTPETWEMMTSADMVVFMGVRAGSTTTARWEAPAAATRIVHFDVDPMVPGANYQTEVAVVGDLRLALAQVNAVLDARDQGAASFGGAAAVAELKRRKFAAFEARAASDATPIRPERIIRDLRETLPADATIVSDPGTSCPYLSAYYPLPIAGRRFLTNRAHGGLGWSLSGALGAWVGRPESKVVAIMGDGSFGFTVGELETVTRLGAPITFIVLANQEFGWIKASQKEGYGARYHNVDITATQHADIAAAYGLKTWRVEDPSALKQSLTAALETNGPSLVEIVTQPLEEAEVPVSRWMG
ncbi:MAG TPA: thiamine pyrophosphate-binding protein, partial [Aliiroseovarius sp.]|nr:thiamine pyrophosphate-binding protein [Aliiroseovarius sp.]